VSGTEKMRSSHSIQRFSDSLFSIHPSQSSKEELRGRQTEAPLVSLDQLERRQSIPHRPVDISIQKFSTPGNAWCSVYPETPTLQCRSPLKTPFLLVTTLSDESTCPLQENEKRTTPETVFSALNWNPEVAPAEFGISPVQTFSLRFSQGWRTKTRFAQGYALELQWCSVVLNSHSEHAGNSLSRGFDLSIISLRISGRVTLQSALQCIERSNDPITNWTHRDPPPQTFEPALASELCWKPHITETYEKIEAILITANGAADNPRIRIFARTSAVLKEGILPK
jgi:hypothetical protein